MEHILCDVRLRLWKLRAMPEVEDLTDMTDSFERSGI